MAALRLSHGLTALLSMSSVLAFQNPVRAPAPDPSMVYVDGYYYLTYTSYDRIDIARATTLGGLADGEVKTIWTDSNSTRNANMWAPEMHQIDDTWHMFYSSCDPAQVCCDSCQTRVLVGCAGPNPWDCTYTFGADLIPPPGGRGGVDKNFAFSIDGTYLEIPCRGRYHVLSIVDETITQCIAIAELDTNNLTVGAWHIISSPDQDWEQITGDARAGINEAPHPLYHDGNIWLSYSGSSCGTTAYAIGLLHYNGGDPLQASSWDKSGPHFTSANGNYGTAHNCFFTSPDGTETWNAFHATSNSAGSCGGDRYTVAQKITFDGENIDFGVPPALGVEMDPPSGE